MKMSPDIFREYDIRGVYDKDFDIEFAEHLGRAHVTFIKNNTGEASPTITIGYDARQSSPAISESLIKGINQAGGNAVRLGLIATPISYFSTFKLPGIAGAIMVTGSHNPPEYNGFKISVGNSTIYGEKIKELEAIINSKKYCSGRGSVKDEDILPLYVNQYREQFSFSEELKVIVDCANGAAGCVVRKLFEATGLKATFLFEEPDGTFPNHHPDPTVKENNRDLIAKVLAEKADIGIGFDGDADRVGVIDSKGNIVYADEIMAIISRDILKEKPGAKIVGDVKCSDRLYADITRHGGEAIMWKTGHSLIKSKIREVGAPFGGEFSGHIFFADRNFGYDDAMYAALRVIEVLFKTKKSIPELLDGFGVAFNTPEIRLDTTEEKKNSAVEELKKAYPVNSKDYKVNLIDGIRISFNDGWALARASNTQPVIVLRFESNTEEGLKRIQTEVEAKLNNILNG